MGFSTRESDVVKLVHPGRHLEYFREPITAGEIMAMYPRHCLARPDFFEFPSIVVHPESVLVPGNVFYLVPYRTIYKLSNAKPKHQQQEYSYLYSKHNQSSKSHRHHNLNPYTKPRSPTKSRAGSTLKHQEHHRNSKTESPNAVNNKEDYIHTAEKIPDTAKSFYKSSFYESWNKMRRNLHQPPESYDPLIYGLDSPFDSGRSVFRLFRNEESQGNSPEYVESLKVKSCLREPDSVRKKLKLKVNFASPLVKSW